MSCHRVLHIEEYLKENMNLKEKIAGCAGMVGFAVWTYAFANIATLPQYESREAHDRAFITELM